MKTTKKDFEQYIVDLCHEIRALLYFQHFTIFFNFEYKTEEAQDGVVGANININETYLRYTVNIFEPTYKSYKEKDYYQTIETLVHEHCHLFIDPIYFFAVPAITNQTADFIENKRETQVQMITNVMMDYFKKQGLIDKFTK